MIELPDPFNWLADGNPPKYNLSTEPVPEDSITFNVEVNKPIMTITRDGIWVDPEVEPTITASQVLNVMDGYIKHLVKTEVEAKDNAYNERNRLVALLSKLYPSGVKKTAIPGWDEAWHGCVFIDFPWGQASWHFHDRDAGLFSHLPQYDGEWDGHTTEEKYAAIDAAMRGTK